MDKTEADEALARLIQKSAETDIKIEKVRAFAQSVIDENKIMEIQKRLLLQLEDSAKSFYSNDGGYTSSIGYLQAVCDCCVLANIPYEEVLNVKEKAQYQVGAD